MKPEFSAPVRGPSYSVLMRAVATVLFLIVVPYALRWWEVVASAGWTSPMALVLVAAFFGMVGSYVSLLRAVTVVDADGIRQTGLTEKQMTWEQVRAVRLARWGVPRLLIRGDRGRSTVFFAGNDALRDAFARVAQAYRPR